MKKISVPSFADGLSKKLQYPSQDRSGYVTRQNSSKMVDEVYYLIRSKGL